jgi:hypothetical protein
VSRNSRLVGSALFLSMLCPALASAQDAVGKQLAAATTPLVNSSVVESHHRPSVDGISYASLTPAASWRAAAGN